MPNFAIVIYCQITVLKNYTQLQNRRDTVLLQSQAQELTMWFYPQLSAGKEASHIFFHFKGQAHLQLHYHMIDVKLFQINI